MNGRTALVVGLGAALLAALWLARRSDDSVRPAGDAGESRAAATPPTLAARGDPTRAATPATEPATTDAADATGAETPKANPVSLRVDLVDALTGEPVEGSWRAVDYAEARLREARAALQALQVRLRELGEDSPAPTAPEPAPVPLAGTFLPSGRPWWFAKVPAPQLLVLRLPPGRTAWSDDGPRVALDLAAGVTAGRYVLPVHRTIPLRLRVFGPDGRRADGAKVSAATVAGRRISDVGESSPDGDLLLPIPFLPGEDVRVALEWVPTPETFVVLEALAPQEGIASPQWSGVVPASPWEDWRAEVRLKGPAGSIHLVEADFDAETEEIVVPSEERVGPVKVRLLDRDGRPIAGVDVSTDPEGPVFGGEGVRTDADGVATFERVPKGSVHFRATAEGRLPHDLRVDAPTAGSTFTAREPAGAALEVTVLDVEGRPRPFAEVHPAAAFFDVVDGVQRLDPHTDARGVRTFARVQPGHAVVRASWAGHVGHGEVDLVDGERASLRIVLK